MNKKLVLLGAALLMTAATASAQKKVTGRVLDATGHPVSGALVQVKGSKVKTATDANGNFTLSNVPAGSKQLSVSSFGMTTATVSISGNVQVTLKENEQQLGEAYVVAYGKATKASFTGAAAKVKGEKIEAKATTEVTEALQGEVAGVQIINDDGNPGASSSIVIRGLGSINSSQTPLIVLDGVPYDGDFSSIDPKDIQSIDVMKDATASALYGSRGANGVVIITTKHGQKGKLHVGADVKYSVSGRWLPTYNTITSPERFTELTWEGMKNGYMSSDYGYDEEKAKQLASQHLFNDDYGLPVQYNMWNAEGADLIDPTTGKFNSGITRKYNPEKWLDELYRTGHKVDGSVNLSGGNDHTTFYTSIGYVKDKGYVVGADFRRFSVRSNVESQITKWLKGSVNLSYANTEQNKSVQNDAASNNALEFSVLCPSIFPVFYHDENGNRVVDENVGGYRYDYGNTTSAGRPYAMGISPAGSANLDMDRTKVDQFTGNASLEVRFLKDFRLTGNLGYTYYNALNDVITNPFYGDAQSVNGRLDKTYFTSRGITGNQILNWGHLYNDVHNVSAFVGHESYWTNTERSYISKYNLVLAKGTQLGNAVSYQSNYGYSYGYALDSWFGQVAYDYDSKYFFNASFRADGSSRFAKGHRWGKFGSISAAWNITKEDFMQNQNVVRNLKLKASWGLVGNQSLSATALSNYAAAYYPFNDIYSIGEMNGNTSLTLSKKGNKDLTWEKTSNWNVGVEFDLGGVLEGEIDYFNKLTYDMLFLKAVNPSMGYASYPVNDGKMRNSGVEINLTAHLVKKENVSFDFRLNAAHYKNEMVEMPLDAGTGQPQDYYQTSYYCWQKGHSLYDFYLREYAGVNPETGVAQYKKLVATFEDGTTKDITNMETFRSQYKGQNYTLSEELTENGAEATYKYTGDSAMPKLTGGFGFDLRIKDFTLSTTFSYGLGGKAFDNTYRLLMGDNSAGAYNWHKDIEKRWQKAGDVTDVPKLSNDSNEGYYASIASTRWLTSRSYLTLSNVTLAYNLPERLTERLGGMHGVQIYATGQNLFYLSARRGFMPSTSISGLSSTTQYLPSSSFTIGLKLNF